MKNYCPEIVGVIGAGSFGTTLASILARNCRVIIYARRQEITEAINAGEAVDGFTLPDNVSATSSAAEICSACRVLVPVVPSASFRRVIRDFSDHLYPNHLMIHATKGFDLVNVNLDSPHPRITKSNLRTMSRVIIEESQVVRVGCISGPNLSVELRKGLPAATVIASDFDEVITVGHHILNSERFKIYGSHDLLGTEIAGALKNMIAVGTGMIAGLHLGKNIESLFITRGLREMLLIGRAMGADSKTFFGTAGIGDLIATATSPDSRNYSFGYQIARGKTKEQIESAPHDLTEGVRTIELIHHFSTRQQLDVPIVEMLYAVIFKGLPLEKAMSYLLEYPYAIDVDYF